MKALATDKTQRIERRSGDPNGSQPAVSAEGLTKTFIVPHQKVHTLKERVLHPFRQYDLIRFKALRDVGFEVRQGEFFGILGRNGSGKSTLLKCLAGIYEVDSGSLKVNGSISPFIELGVGFNPDLPARDNILINAALLGLRPREALARFDAIIEFAELEDFVDLKFKNYSSGMQVRLGFAAAIQADADLLLVDEVLAVGDANFQQKCFDTFREIKRSGRTVLFVSHDLATMEKFCDRAMYIEAGEVVDIASPQEAIRQYTEVNLQRQRKSKVSVPYPKHFVTDPENPLDSTHRFAHIETMWLEDAELNRQSVVLHDEEVTVRMRVLFSGQVEHPIMSITIHSDEDKQPILFWASTKSTGIETPVTEKGDVLDFSLSFRNLLVNGRYYLSAIVSTQDESATLDQRVCDELFLVTGSEHGSGQVALPHSADLVYHRAVDRERRPSQG